MVVIQDLVPNTLSSVSVLQSAAGFRIRHTVNDQQVIVTNNHVIDGAINETVTFADGNSYPAKVLGQTHKQTSQSYP